MARRAGYIKSYSEKKDAFVVNLELGSFFLPLGPGSTPTNALMLDALDMLPMHVFNLTSEDLFLWKEIAARKFERTHFLSTNLVAPARYQTKPETSAIVEVPGAGAGGKALRIGFIGFADPASVKPNSGFRAKDPLEAAASVVPQLKGKVDFIVAVGEISDELAEALAERFPEIYAVLKMNRLFQLPTPQQVKNAVVMSSVERGRYLGQLEFSIDADGKVQAYQPDLVEMSRDVPDEPSIQRRVVELKAVLD